MWTKQGGLTFNMIPFMEGSVGDKTWGYPERSAGIAIFGGLTNLSPGGGSHGSCMLPYIPRSGDQPADLVEVARIDHLRYAYGSWGSIPVEKRMIS
jgi:hypothetical protein